MKIQALALALRRETIRNIGDAELCTDVHAVSPIKTRVNSCGVCQLTRPTRG